MLLSGGSLDALTTTNLERFSGHIRCSQNVWSWNKTCFALNVNWDQIPANSNNGQSICARRYFLQHISMCRCVSERERKKQYLALSFSVRCALWKSKGAHKILPFPCLCNKARSRKGCVFMQTIKVRNINANWSDDADNDDNSNANYEW